MPLCLTFDILSFALRYNTSPPPRRRHPHHGMMSSSRTATDSSTSPSNPSGHLPVGRKLDPAWSQVDVDPEGGVWCKRCTKLIQTTGRTHVERVKHHLSKKCSNRASAPLITAMFSPKLKPGVIKVLQEQLALWIYSTGMAFYKVEHQSLLDALQLLTPGIEVPSRDQLSTVLLDRAYLKSLKLPEVSLQGKVVTVSSDGWTDICGRAVLNYVAVCGDRSFFLETVYTGDQAHDAVFLANDMQRVIEKYHFLNVGAVITDNTPANKAMWANLQTKFPRTFFHGCVCHALHLLVKDMVRKLTWLDRLLDGCKKLVVFFKSNHKLRSQLTSRLRDHGLRLIAKPGETRWGSLQLCFETILAAEAVLHSLATMHPTSRESRLVGCIVAVFFPVFLTSVDH
ncbi:unnamed protein product [Phytophthora fragariaefolia]|uniref:Unnamed protein product n=1 Tax=Phytophthora fragariaefolia TaxID=1490495 RepID=A0A9W6UBT5_9STRA|nr:unnamed protein product [Phytophthora fragariaefolia]